MPGEGEAISQEIQSSLTLNTGFKTCLMLGVLNLPQEAAQYGQKYLRNEIVGNVVQPYDAICYKLSL